MSIGVVNHGEGEGNLDCSMHALQVCVARAAGTAHSNCVIVFWRSFGKASSLLKLPNTGAV